jgi:hypothetical protein
MLRFVAGMLVALALSCTAASAQASNGPRPSAAPATPAKSQYLMAVPSQERPVAVKKKKKRK